MERKIRCAAAVLAAAALTVSCGGGGGSSAPSGPAPAPTAALSPPSLAFGNQNLNTQSAAQTVAVSNSGNAALSITSIAITGTDASDFAETNGCGTSLAAGTECTIAVTFKPAAAGALSASLAVTDNASGSPQSVALTGTGTYAPLSITVSPSTATAPESTTVSLTASVTGGSGNATVTWAVPAVGTLSSTTGSSVTYTAPATVPNPPTETLTATATDSTGTAMNTATVTIVSFLTFTPFEYECPNQCLLQTITMNGSGFTENGGISISPSANVVASYYDANTEKLTISFDDNGNDWNPGAYAVSRCASSGVQCTPTGYLSFGGAGGNLGGVGGTNNSEEFRLDPGSDSILRYNLSDASAETPITFTSNPTALWGTAFAVDGNNLIRITAGGGVTVLNASTGAGAGGSGNSTSTAAQVAGKNGIVGWSDPTNGTVSFFNSSQSVNPTVVSDTAAGTAPRAISMTAGCSGIDAFTFDEQGLQLVWDNVTLPSPTGVPVVKQVGTFSLGAGFAAASLINYNMYRRFVLTTDKACEAAVLAPYVTTGTNTDGSTSFQYALALVTADPASGTMAQPQFEYKDAQGNLVVTPFLTDATLGANVKLAVMAPGGNAVYVETENVADGSGGLVKIAWTTAADSNLSVTVTNMGTVTPTGGFFGTSMVMDPNGNFIDLGMRQQPLVRVPLD